MAEFVGDLLDLIPGVGHTKAIVHYACGDKEGANKAWTSATRTVAVLGAGVIGHAVAGPVGAAVKATVTAVCYSSMTTALQEGRQVDGSIANPVLGVDSGDHRGDSSDESDYEEENRVPVAQVEIFMAVVQDITRLMRFEGGIPFADQHNIINRCFKDFLTAAIPLMNSSTIRLTISYGQLKIVGVNRQIIPPYQAVGLSMAVTRAITNARPIRQRCSRQSCRFCPNLREIQWEGRSGNCETINVIYSFYCNDCHRIVYAGQTTRPLRARISDYLDSEGSPLRRHIASTAGHRNAMVSDLLDIFSIIPMWSTNGVETQVYDRSIRHIVKNWAVFMQWLI